MIRITKCDSDHELATFQYRIANQLVEFDAMVSSLTAYLVEKSSLKGHAEIQELKEQGDSAALLDASNAELYYEGQAPFADRPRQVDCWRRASELQINVDGQAICRVDFKAAHIHLLNSGDYDDVLHLEVITGPALILLLAELNIFCLHAGSVETPSGIVAFVAESGVGKSTLSKSAGPHWQQVADDILPIVGSSDLPDSQFPDFQFNVSAFPQLKLVDQATGYFPQGDQPIDILIRLAGRPTDSIEFKPLAGTQAILEVIRHTVAAKLFSAQRMQAHMQFAKLLVKQVPVVQLSYPRDIKQLSSLRESITDYMTQQASAL